MFRFRYINVETNVNVENLRDSKQLLCSCSRILPNYFPSVGAYSDSSFGSHMYLSFHLHTNIHLIDSRKDRCTRVTFMIVNLSPSWSTDYPTDKENEIFRRGVGRNTRWGPGPRSDPKSVVLGSKLKMANGALPRRECALLLAFKIHEALSL